MPPVFCAGGTTTAHVETVAPSAGSGLAPGCPVRRSLAMLLVGYLATRTARRGASDCLLIREARPHVGETEGITGKGLYLKAGAQGVHFIDFCEERAACRFSVVVFPSE
jgi:hypothetical protein